jgi:zinc D-Ala-D-Ala dipeptidase
MRAGRITSLRSFIGQGCLITGLCLLAAVPSSPVIAADSSVKASLQAIGSSTEFTEVTSLPGVVIDLRYASTNNFTGENLYGEFNRAFLHRIAADKLAAAAANLRAVHADYRLIIFDALRPRSVQRRLWDKVKGTEQQEYVADPDKGSVHNFGFAVDLSIVDGRGIQLDMGTAFDDFTPLAQPQLEAKYLEAGKLSQVQLANRQLLRKVMEDAGFIQLPIEWWHYDALPKAQVLAGFQIVE